jgi:SAM-dependent methyltransferase
MTGGWDRLASSYDQVAGAYEHRFLHELDAKPRDRELLEAFAAAVDDPVVDLGCGPGQIGAFVRARGRAVVGVDLSRAMARLAARRLDGAAAADMRTLPLAPGRVGGVVAFYSLIHLRRPELRPAVAAVAAALRPGGRLLCSAHEGDGEYRADEFLGRRVPFAATFFALDELVGAAADAGLAVVRAERREPYPTESRTFRLYLEAVRP